MLAKHYAPSGNKVQKAIFSFKVKVKVTWWLTISGVCMPNMKFLVSLTVQNLQRRLKVMTGRQTNRQDKNNMPPTIRSRGIKILPLLFSPFSPSGLRANLKLAGADGQIELYIKGKNKTEWIQNCIQLYLSVMHTLVISIYSLLLFLAFAE